MKYIQPKSPACILRRLVGLVAFLVVAGWFSVGTAQTDPLKLDAVSVSEQQILRTKYSSVVTQLAAVEGEILDLQNSEAQTEFQKLESLLTRLNKKRERLRELERQWKSLGQGMPALEIDPRLNSTDQSDRQMLVQLEGSKEKVLRLKAELLMLKSEFGSGHPGILDVANKLEVAEQLVADQTEHLGEMGIEIKSTVVKERLQKALLRRAELKSKFGPGHPNVTRIESEIGMLDAEVKDSPHAFAPRHSLTIELVNATIDLEEASKLYGGGHPVLKTMKQKIQVMEDFAKSEALSQAPDNDKELARRLETRIEVLQDGILFDEAELDVGREMKAEFNKLKEKTALLLEQRQKLSAEMDRLSVVKPVVLSDEGRVRVKKQLLDGIDALESLGKSSDAKRLREILKELGEQ